MVRLLPVLMVAVACARGARNDAALAVSLRARATAAYDHKDFPGCAALFEQAARADARSADEDEYGAACCLSLAGDKDRAFARLESAVVNGFRDAAHLQKDEDLAALRDDPRWQPIVDRTRAASEKHFAGSNAELRRLYEEDQAARQGGWEKIDWSVVNKQDAERRQRVGAIVAAGGAKLSLDYYHAAMVFQHGMEVADIRTAYDLAMKAVALDASNRQARWLAAAAKDRELMYEGKPQRYGTQYRKVDGKWQLYPVEPTVTDEERAEWNVPPLAEAKKRAEGMNRP